MDSFLAKLSHHATSYAIRSCLAFTSTYMVQQGSKLLKRVDDASLRAELSLLQSRLALKIDLISPILEMIEFRYNRGNTALETVIRVSSQLRDEIEALSARFSVIADVPGKAQPGMTVSASTGVREPELQEILVEIKRLIVQIDDATPLINLWVSTVGGIETERPSYSPSRLLQASYLVNVGDTQFVIDPSQAMQIGPDFTVSIYMLFRGHALTPGVEEAYGVDDGQRKPIWQEVLHKGRVRLYRLPRDPGGPNAADCAQNQSLPAYHYRLQLVEDLEDGRMHDFEDGDQQPGPYDGVRLAGIRDSIPIAQIAKMFYVDVGRILNIENESGASSKPVLLLKRDAGNHTPGTEDDPNSNTKQTDGLFKSQDPPNTSKDSIRDTTPVEPERQNEGRSGHETATRTTCPTPEGVSDKLKLDQKWSLPRNLDPEWLAMEVFDPDSEAESSEDDESLTDVENTSSTSSQPRTALLPSPARPSVDSNLAAQLRKMNVASYRPPDSSSAALTTPSPLPGAASHLAIQAQRSAALIAQSPFGAIKTSLALLEMLLRLTSLQEFEQRTHLAIHDHVLSFYLEESTSTSDLTDMRRGAGRRDEMNKVGFDLYPHLLSPGAQM